MQTTSSSTHVRRSGVLLHPTSLPGIYGIGELGDQVVAFLDWAQRAGMRMWQVLPLNPPSFGASPYGCLSSFAGNPLLISPQRLLRDGLLESGDVARVPRFSDDHVEFDSVHEYKFALLALAWKRFEERATRELSAALETFVEAPEQREWLPDYALFMALKTAAEGAPWWTWEEPFVNRDEKALTKARHDHEDEIRFWEFVQFLFFRQWDLVREAARARGIAIVGDVPIYVAGDSADVWGHRELFQLDERGEPTAVAGVPPDYFSANGQRWGNPLYRWDVMRQTGYRWWIARIRTNLRMADVVRLDHFRGFAAYWEIPASEPTAVHGRWMPGPGLALFDAIRAELGDLPLIAEDLGFITEDVHELRKSIGLPGMKVLQFGFSQIDSPHLPHRYERQTVAYTGTHDNDTARGWFDHATDLERDNVLNYLGCTVAEVPWALIRAAYSSVAEAAIVPLQDILRLGSEARMNTPGAEKHNWTWRVQASALTHATAEKLRKLAVVTGRV